MAKKKEPEPEGHEMPPGIVEDVVPSEDKTQVREITDDDGNILSDDELYGEADGDTLGAGSGDPSVDHPEPVRGGSTSNPPKYKTKSVVQENEVENPTEDDLDEDADPDDDFGEDDDEADDEEDNEDDERPA